MAKKYNVIYADPAWEYNTKECLAKTSILNGKLNTHYSTMTLNELKALNVQSISDKNCMLFLWVVSPMLKEGIEVMETWGFKYATIAFIWYKQRTNPGHYTMSECEICLVGKRGIIPTPRGSRNIRQFLSEMRGKHSAKPNEIRTRIEAMFPTQNKIELFARQNVEGWDCWGNEVEGSINFNGLEQTEAGGAFLKISTSNNLSNETILQALNLPQVSKRDGVEREHSVCCHCGYPKIIWCNSAQKYLCGKCGKQQTDC